LTLATSGAAAQRHGRGAAAGASEAADRGAEARATRGRGAAQGIEGIQGPGVAATGGVLGDLANLRLGKMMRNIWNGLIVGGNQ